MIKTKKIYARGFYLLRGEASANSCFIENMREAKLFIRLVNRYLKDYVKVHEYLLTAEGWLIQVTIRRRKKVLKAYRMKKKRLGRKVVHTELWRIISEQMRLVLSQYVKLTNKMEGRSGSKVKESYHRYYFTTAKEACDYLDRMRNQKIKLIQRKKKYRKVKSHYRISWEEAKGSIFLCSVGKKSRKEGRRIRKEIGLECLSLLNLEPLVVGKMVINTAVRQNRSKSPPFF